MQAPEYWDDRSPLEYVPLKTLLIARTQYRNKRGDRSWITNIAKTLKKDSQCKKAIETWLGIAYADIVEDPEPRIMLDKGPYELFDYEVFIEFYDTLHRNEGSSWEAESFIDGHRKKVRKLAHGIKNRGGEEPSTWGKSFVQIPTEQDLPDIISAQRVFSSPAAPEMAGTSTKATSSSKRRGGPRLNVLATSSLEGPVKQQPKKQEPKKKRGGRSTRSTGSIKAHLTDPETKDDEETGERPSKRRKKSITPLSDLSELTDDVQSPPASPASPADIRLSTLPVGETAVNKSTSPGVLSPSVVPKSPTKKYGKKARRSNAKVDAAAVVLEEPKLPNAEEEISTDAPPAPATKTKTRRGRQKATKSADEPDAMEVDKLEEEPVHKLTEKGNVDASPKALSNDIDTAEVAEATAPITNIVTDNAVSSPPTSNSRRRAPPPSRGRKKGRGGASGVTASNSTGVDGQGKAAEETADHQPATTSPAEEKPHHISSPSPSHDEFKVTDYHHFQESDLRSEPRVSTNGNTAVSSTDINGTSRRDTVDKPVSKPSLTVVTEPSQADDAELSPQVSLSPSPSPSVAQEVDAHETTGVNGNNRIKPSSKAQKSLALNGLADMYNTAFVANAELNKGATEKGQELRFNSEAGGIVPT